MGRRDQAEEMSQAADRIVEATKELSATINRWIEVQYWYRQQAEERLRERNPEIGFLAEWQDREMLSEEEAIAIAMHEVSEVRRLSNPRRGERLPPPDAGAIEEWKLRREDRRRREDPQ